MRPDVRRTRVLLAALLIAAFALVSVDHAAGRGSPLDGLRRAALAVFGPVESALSAAGAWVSDSVNAVARSAQGGRADRLARENAALRARLAVSEPAPAAGAAERLLGLAAGHRFRLVGARVVGVVAGLGGSWTVTLDVGRVDGIRPDLPVVTGAGLVGRVRDVAATTCTVLLATDPASRVGVRVAGTGELGVLTGQSAGPYLLQLLAVAAPLRVGAVVSTYGSPGGRPFAAAIPVGRIVRVLAVPAGAAPSALVEPAVGFSRLDLVGVVLGAPPVTHPRPARQPAPPAVVPAPGG